MQKVSQNMGNFSSEFCMGSELALRATADGCVH